MVFINVSDDVRQAQTRAWGGYTTTERDSGETFSSQAKISGYIPQLPHAKFSFPFVAVHDGSSSAFSNRYIGWQDPVLGHENYQLDVDVNFLLAAEEGVGSRTNAAVLSRVRQYNTSEKNADEYRGNQVGEDQHAVLCRLGIGDSLHSAENRVEEDDRHPDGDTDVDIHLEEAAEDDADTPHLPCDVGE